MPNFEVFWILLFPLLSLWKVILVMEKKKKNSQNLQPYSSQSTPVVPGTQQATATHSSLSSQATTDPWLEPWGLPMPWAWGFSLDFHGLGNFPPLEDLWRIISSVSFHQLSHAGDNSWCLVSTRFQALKTEIIPGTTSALWVLRKNPKEHLMFQCYAQDALLKSWSLLEL